MTALTLALLAALAAGQARPVTLISEVKAAIAAHDLSRAEALVAARRAEQGDTPEAIEAVSWLGRGAPPRKEGGRAEGHPGEEQRLRGRSPPPEGPPLPDTAWAAV